MKLKQLKEKLIDTRHELRKRRSILLSRAKTDEDKEKVGSWYAANDLVMVQRYDVERLTKEEEIAWELDNESLATAHQALRSRLESELPTNEEKARSAEEAIVHLTGA